MDFEKLKNEIEESVANEPVEPVALSKNQIRHPVDGLRRRWKLEIVIHLLILLVLLFDVAFMSPLHELPNAVFLICLSVVTFMTFAWFIKTIRFLHRTSDFTADTVRAVDEFIWEARLTLESQIAYSIAGCTLLPIALFALFTGDAAGERIYGEGLFDRVFLLKLEGIGWLWLLLGYSVCMFVLCYFSEWWFRRTYKRFVSPLEDIAKSLREGSG